MYIQTVWKEIKSFNKKADNNDFYHLLPTLGYKFLAYKAIDSKNKIITRRKYLVLSPSNRIETIVLGKTFNILSITGK
jgi:hypothetical protein